MSELRSAREALDAQVTLCRDYQSEGGRVYSEAFVDGFQKLGWGHEVTAPTRERLFEGLVAAFTAPTVWVSAEVRDLVRSAASIGEEQLRHDDAPGDSGVIWIEGGAPFWHQTPDEAAAIDGRLNALDERINDLRLRCDAMGDVPDDDPLAVELRALTDETKAVCAELDLARGHLGFQVEAIGWRRSDVGVTTVGFLPTTRWMGRHDFRWVPSHLAADWMIWFYDTPWTEGPQEDDRLGAVRYHDGHPGRDVPPSMAAMRRWLLALWRFMAQEIVETVPTNVDRGTRRRAQRTHLSDNVTVLRLRRISHSTDSDGDDANARYTIRFWVVGHWRTLHRGTDRERKVWVRPHVKGPDDAPIAEAKRRVVSVER